MENALTRRYELMLIVDAHLGQEEKEVIFKEASQTVTNSGGRVLNAHVWLEKHKLTFPIKKYTDGTYYLVNYEAESSVNAAIRSELRLREQILRFAITRVESRQEDVKAKAKAKAEPADISA